MTMPKKCFLVSSRENISRHHVIYDRESHSPHAWMLPNKTLRNWRKVLVRISLSLAPQRGFEMTTLWSPITAGGQGNWHTWDTLFYILYGQTTIFGEIVFFKYLCLYMSFLFLSIQVSIHVEISVLGSLKISTKGLYYFSFLLICFLLVAAIRELSYLMAITFF